MPQGIHRMRPGAERKRGEQIDEAAKLEVLRQLQGAQRPALKLGPRGPEAHLLRHFRDEAIPSFHENTGVRQTQRVRQHHGRHEVRGLARHDEAGESLVNREQHEPHAQIEIGLVSPLSKMVSTGAVMMARATPR